MQPNPVFVRIGPISIYWYGVLIVLGSMLGAQIASKLSRRNGHNPEIAWNLLLIALVTGIIGARLYHVVSSWDYYSQNPGEIFGLQMAGFGIFGAFLGGLLGVWIFCRHYKLRFLEWADYCTPGLLLAQAIGRWGNYFNSELYGPPTNLPWGIYIAPEHRLPMFVMYERFHPVFFYESALNLIGALVLLYLAYRWRKNRLWGDILFLYGMIYPVIRFFIEFLRPDAWKMGSIPVAQLVSIGSFVFFGALLITRHILRRPSMLYAPGSPWQAPAAPASVSELVEATPAEIEAPAENAAQPPAPDAPDASSEPPTSQPSE